MALVDALTASLEATAPVMVIWTHPSSRSSGGVRLWHAYCYRCRRDSYGPTSGPVMAWAADHLNTRHATDHRRARADV